jgi:signal transduction histidine kinase
MSCRPSAITRALSNLIDNAVNYGETATVTLFAEPASIAITVEDEGPGIPRAEREKVFEPFYRADMSRDPNAGGIGLGLAVTRSILAEHGGRILLSNRKGGGLRVRLEFLCSRALSKSHGESRAATRTGLTTTPRLAERELRASL